MNRNCGFRDASGEFFVTNKNTVVSLINNRNYEYRMKTKILMKIQNDVVIIPEEFFSYD